MQTNYERYVELWTRYYSAVEFGGTSVAAAADYAARDCMNITKGWTQAQIDDDLVYQQEQIDAALRK